MRGLTPLALIERELARASRPCMTLSFQADGVALAHMMRGLDPGLPMLFVDTWHHFPETLAYAEWLTRAWGLNVVTLRATDAGLAGVNDLTMDEDPVNLTDAENGDLNVLGINCLRTFPARPTCGGWKHPNTPAPGSPRATGAAVR